MINAEILKRLEQIFHATVMKWECRIVEFNGEADHIHLIIDYNPKVQISKFVNNLKTVSSRLIRKEFATILDAVYSKPVFWTGAYFVASCGGVTVEQLKQYVQSQDLRFKCKIRSAMGNPTKTSLRSSMVGVPSQLLMDGFLDALQFLSCT